VLATQTVLSGRYRLDTIIGRGGGADVYRADDLVSGRAVAVKVLRGASADDLRRFAVEAETLARLDHPAIVRMCDRGEQDGRPYLVLDLIEGEPLSTVLLRGAMGEDDVARMGAVLAGALAHAHSIGVVHRDVKPGNVLFDATGDAHLTDFGIARLTDATSITSTGLVIGTAAYLSPEQISGDGASSASDVYALGLVLIEALSGVRAFGGTPSESAIARLHRSPEIPAAASPALAMLLEAMTAMEPATRPTAAVVAASLHHDATSVLPIAGEMTAAIPVAVPGSSGAAPVVARHEPRGRWITPLVLAAAAVLLFLFGWASGGSGLTVPASVVAPPPTTAAPVTTTASSVPTTSAPQPANHGKGHGNSGDQGD
jgi:serine/threonine protein kinase